MPLFTLESCIDPKNFARFRTIEGTFFWDDLDLTAFTWSRYSFEKSSNEIACTGQAPVRLASATSSSLFRRIFWASSLVATVVFSRRRLPVASW